MSKKKKGNQQEQERTKLDYDKMKRLFQWIATIGPAKDRGSKTTFCMRVTFNRTASRIKNFGKEKDDFEGYLRDFYRRRNKQVSTQWKDDCVIVTVT